MGKFFWLSFIGVASVSGALVWHFAPILGERLPPDVRRRICAAVDSTVAQFSGKGEAQDRDAAREGDGLASQRVRPAKLTDAEATWGVLNRVTPVEGLDGKSIGNVAGGKLFLIKETVSTANGLAVTGTFFEAKKLKGTVRIPAENLVCFSGQPADLSDNQRECLCKYYQLTSEARVRKAKVENEVRGRNPYQRDLDRAVKQLRAREAAAKRLAAGDLEGQRKMTYEIKPLSDRVNDLLQKHKAWATQNAASLPDPEKDATYLGLLREREACAESINDLLLR